ncbi:phospholipid phosphatase-related protein type 2 isoform X3 [Camelus ferus]|uniref:Phospholipid phosphatase-related protein type 2 n=4 Tax=Camelus TaxID=9836 RepID=A0A8B8RW10_CAMFR|nr:phospholipid phosphatase-related protein type 2 isoform X3 [Camelus ferus]
MPEPSTPLLGLRLRLRPGPFPATAQQEPLLPTWCGSSPASPQPSPPGLPWNPTSEQLGLLSRRPLQRENKLAETLLHLWTVAPAVSSLAWVLPLNLQSPFPPESILTRPAPKNNRGSTPDHANETPRDPAPRVMQMMFPEAPPLAPPLSLRGAAGPAGSISISALARWPALCLSVRPAAPGPSRRSRGSGGGSLDPVREQATGWGTGLRVPTLTCLGLHFHICAMGVTIPALLATRSGCPAFTMAGGRPQLKRSFSIIPCFVFVESVLLGIVVLLAYRLEFTDTFPVHTQGFFCYDSTYAKPYPGPEAASRVPPALVYALVTAGPTLTILLGELARAFFPTPPSAIPIIGESTIVSGACCRFSPPLRRLVRFLGVYSFGLFTTTIFANAGQVVTGNPTPHFLSVCRPNYTALGCLPPSPDRPGPDRFVTDQGACAGSPSLVAAARRAFPCKDAALCAYAVTYTAMYVTLVFRVKGSRLVKPSLCLALLCPAFLVGVVRVAEYRNHWSDVLAGFLTGAAIATFLVTCVVHNFQSRPPSGRRLSPWEDLSQAPTMDSPLEKNLRPAGRIRHRHGSPHPSRRTAPAVAT